MWEDASKKDAKAPNLPPKDRETAQAPKRRRGGDTLLWTQLLLCTALIAAVLAARFCYRPLYRSMQRLFYEALEAPAWTWTADMNWQSSPRRRRQSCGRRPGR